MLSRNKPKAIGIKIQSNQSFFFVKRYFKFFHAIGIETISINVSSES